MIDILLIVIGIILISYIGFKILKSMIKAVIVALVILIIILAGIVGVGYYDYKKIKDKPFYVEILEENESISQFRAKGIKLSELEPMAEMIDGNKLQIDISVIESYIPEEIKGIKGKEIIIEKIRNGSPEITAGAIVFTLKEISKEDLKDNINNQKIMMEPKPVTYKVITYLIRP